MVGAVSPRRMGVLDVQKEAAVDQTLHWHCRGNQQGLVPNLAETLELCLVQHPACCRHPSSITTKILQAPSLSQEGSWNMKFSSLLTKQSQGSWSDLAAGAGTFLCRTAKIFVQCVWKRVRPASLTGNKKPKILISFYCVLSSRAQGLWVISVCFPPHAEMAPRLKLCCKCMLLLPCEMRCWPRRLGWGDLQCLLLMNYPQSRKELLPSSDASVSLSQADSAADQVRCLVPQERRLREKWVYKLLLIPRYPQVQVGGNLVSSTAWIIHRFVRICR